MFERISIPADATDEEIKAIISAKLQEAFGGAFQPESEAAQENMLENLIAERDSKRNRQLAVNLDGYEVDVNGSFVKNEFNAIQANIEVDSANTDTFLDIFNDTLQENMRNRQTLQMALAGLELAKAALIASKEKMVEKDHSIALLENRLREAGLPVD